jgi:hypothetical protein
MEGIVVYLAGPWPCPRTKACYHWCYFFNDGTNGDNFQDRVFDLVVDATAGTSTWS